MPLSFQSLCSQGFPYTILAYSMCALQLSMVQKPCISLTNITTELRGNKNTHACIDNGIHGCAKINLVINNKHTVIFLFKKPIAAEKCNNRNKTAQINDTPKQCLFLPIHFVAFLADLDAHSSTHSSHPE